MRLAYVTTYNATDITKWSGTSCYIAKFFEQQAVSINHINPLERKIPPFFKIKNLFYKQLLQKKILLDRDPYTLKSYAWQVTRKLAGLQADVVFSTGTIPIAYLECNQPIVFWTDATFAGMVDFYSEFTNLCSESVSYGNAMEQSALKRCKLALYSSEWAAETAINNYQVDKSKVHVVPYGANIECDRNHNDIKNIVEARATDKCKLIFLGTDWFRKGGNIAFKVTKKLNDLGLNTELTVVGCQPIVDAPLPSYIRVLGFISKATKEGKQQLAQLLTESHFLILPSKADCTPIVFCEANSFGVPCISVATGGIPTVIKDNINGKTFSIDADNINYCNYILNLFSNYYQYKDLALSAFNEYQTRLNWLSSVKTVKKLLIHSL